MSDTDVLQLRGGAKVDGNIDIKGSKNALPKIMVAAMLTEERCEIENVSWLSDTRTMTELIEASGGTVGRSTAGLSIEVSTLGVPDTTAMREFSGRSRIPVLTCGPALHRTGEAYISSPGGCTIGPRPVDFHLDVLRRLGAETVDVPGGIQLSATRLTGAKIELPFPSVGATEQFLLSACLADGDSELCNAAVEPEILDLITVLQKMGSLINVETNRAITVTGVKRLRGFTHRVIPDRLEAASWASLALATDGEITLDGVRQQDLATYLNTYRRAGGDFEASPDGTTIRFWRSQSMLRPLAVETSVHPGFMTDWQSPFVTALTQADGISVIHETVYEDRTGYVDALKALGANIGLFTECLGGTTCRFARGNHPHSIVVVGPTKLQGTELHVPDLRAGFSYLIAAAAANGVSTITGIDLLDRGYENLRGKMATVGIDFE
ncbi:MAG: UDP-N-acetylglucosamine 1-carboxyvinyltransferase [Acidimicrobiia bacterium]|nr:UDP-N-acetylglucosamine 1-carboxyvinyltransferase [Acidimicrobiia bacterium]